METNEYTVIKDTIEYHILASYHNQELNTQFVLVQKVEYHDGTIDSVRYYKADSRNIRKNLYYRTWDDSFEAYNEWVDYGTEI